MKRLRKQNIFYFSAAIFGLVILIFFTGSNTSLNIERGSTSFNDGVLSVSVKIKGVEISVEIVRTEAEREKGLSGRASLDTRSGMLFIFDKPGTYPFWMPDMNFPIDMIWIDNGKVVDISENVPNDFDPGNPRFYTPSVSVKYVLEVNAGFASAHGIKIGDTVTFRGILPSE